MGHHATKWLLDQVTLSWGVGLKVVKGVSSRREGCLPVFCSHGITSPLEVLIQTLLLTPGEGAGGECRAGREALALL